MTEDGASAVQKVLTGIRRADLNNEAAVERFLVDPCLEALGWHLVPRVNKQVQLHFTPERARFWRYSTGWMKRDYVFTRPQLGPLHVEAKRRWGMKVSDLEGFLRRASSDDWAGSEGDGMWKDLALLLWGTRSQAGTRAAIVDDSRILVFDWTDRWSIRAQEQIFDAPTTNVSAAFCLLSPSGQ